MPRTRFEVLPGQPFQAGYQYVTRKEIEGYLPTSPASGERRLDRRLTMPDGVDQTTVMRFGGGSGGGSGVPSIILIAQVSGRWLGC
jgi:hypothetical protein